MGWDASAVRLPDSVLLLVHRLEDEDVRIADCCRRCLDLALHERPVEPTVAAARSRQRDGLDSPISNGTEQGRAGKSYPTGVMAALNPLQLRGVPPVLLGRELGLTAVSDSKRHRRGWPTTLSRRSQAGTWRLGQASPTSARMAGRLRCKHAGSTRPGEVQERDGSCPSTQRPAAEWSSRWVLL